LIRVNRVLLPESINPREILNVAVPT